MVNPSTAVTIVTHIIFFNEIMCTLGSFIRFQKYVTSEHSFNSTPDMQLTFNGVSSTIECGSHYWLILQNLTLMQTGVIINSFTMDKANQICRIGFTATDAVMAAQGLTV